MNQSLDRLYDIVEKEIQAINDSLKVRLKERKLDLVVNSGITKTNNGRLGYITCFPHGPSEESLDGIFEITEFVDAIKVSIGVYWSNGISVLDIGEIILSADYTETQMDKLKNMVMELTDMIIQTLT